MSEEVTLEAFATATDEENPDNSKVEADASDGEREDHAGDAAEVSPVLPTAVYDPDGVRCAGCSDSVERLFRTDGDLRCPKCSAWQSRSAADGT